MKIKRITEDSFQIWSFEGVKSKVGDKNFGLKMVPWFSNAAATKHNEIMFSETAYYTVKCLD